MDRTGQNPKILSAGARRGSGGDGILIKEQLSGNYDWAVLDNKHV